MPAAALTAYARSQDRITSLASGFQMHLVKPIDPLELIVGGVDVGTSTDGCPADRDDAHAHWHIERTDKQARPPSRPGRIAA